MANGEAVTASTGSGSVGLLIHGEEDKHADYEATDEDGDGHLNLHGGVLKV